MPKELRVGDAAPNFRATAVGGKYGAGQEVTLADFRGKPLVLYFYPKDDNPGCTAQACGLRDAWKEVKDRAVIFGVSVDPAKSHTRFIEKFQLPFPLLSDPAHEMVKTYGVWVQKKSRQEIHGNRAEHFCYRPHRENRRDLSQGEAR